MTLPSPTAFAAHDPAPFRPVESTSFAAYEVDGTDLGQPGRRPEWLATESAGADAMRHVAQSMTAVFADIGPALIALVPRLDRSMLSEIAAVFRSALRDVVVGSTTVATAVRWTLEPPESTVADAAGERTSAAEDRRIYALASVEKLQRILHLNQDEVASLAGISRPTIWNWQRGRSPQERSLRRLHDVASTVDILVDRFGGEVGFDLSAAERELGLAEPVAAVLFESNGPQAILDAIFADSRRSSRARLLPDASDLLSSEDDKGDETVGSSQGYVGRRRKVRRRTDG